MTALGHPVVGLVAGYLLGSIPASYLVCKWGWGVDLRTIGSGNPGATNALRALGPKAGVPALLLDAAKGAAAIHVARTLAPPLEAVLPATYQLVCGLMAVVGHTFPLFLGFKGGKGVATAAGVMIVMAPRCVGLAVLVFGTTVALTRYVSLASILATAAFPLFVALLVDEARGPLIGLSSLLALFIAYRHRANIGRLLAGTENKLGARPRTEDTTTASPTAAGDEPPADPTGTGEGGRNSP